MTANWNRALAASEGDYTIMLGDDDALLPGYLRAMDELIARFSAPDVIYTKALLFTYPGVDPQRPAGSLMEHGCGDFFAGAQAPFVLDRDRALELVRGAMDFRLRYDFNAQFALISRRLIDALARLRRLLPVGLSRLLLDERGLPERASHRHRPCAARGDRRDAEVLRLLPCQRPRSSEGRDFLGAAPPRPRPARTSTSAG